ncbi:MAG: S1 RNA-binding domain-containing protein, partial [Candidatus Aenigmarchaeota archaeon]|nr:S1 RNA-binding domain-containing protein [Candidatus Aenigmarchaeota archaeon]
MKKIPSKGELVVCRITRVNPHSAFAYIEDYDREGMIHISEVASGWIKDIKNHLKVGQIAVTKV